MTDQEEKYPYRLADNDNRGWLTCGDGIYKGFDPSSSMPRPLTDDQLAALAEQPGHPTLTVEQMATIVEHLPLRVPQPENDPTAGLRALADRLDIPGLTEERMFLIVERINTEKIEQYGHPSPRFHLERRLLDARPLAEIERHFGPVRPVLPMTETDADELKTAFDLAGRKLITSVASAVEQVYHEARERFGPWHRDAGGTADYAQRTLTAGRPGSWEAEVIMQVVYFGNELNLHPHKASLSVEKMRETGPNPKRVHIEARDQIAEVLRRWTNSPDRYTEVAETLGATIARYADETYGADGWKKIADQWLQPGGLAKENFHHCYHVLYSTSAHFNADHLSL